MGAQPEVDAARLGIYGTSYGGATVVFVAAIDGQMRGFGGRHRQRGTLDAQRAPPGRVP